MTQLENLFEDSTSFLASRMVVGWYGISWYAASCDSFQQLIHAFAGRVRNAGVDVNVH